MEPTATQSASFGQIVRNLKDQRLWRIFLIGCASGYPWVLIGGNLSLWLRQEGFERKSIGFIGFVFTVYTINFLWAPILDSVKLNFFGIGQRKSWIVLCQCAIVAFTILMALMGPNWNLALFVVAVIGIGAASATQDLAIDAYRITVIREDEKEMVGLGAAMATGGWWVGSGLPSGILLYLTDLDAITWNSVYLVAAVAIVPITAVVAWFFEEPKLEQVHVGRNWFLKVLLAYVDTIRDFFRRHGVEIALSLLLFIVLFKIGEAFLGRMAKTFYEDVGFTNSHMGTADLIDTAIVIVFSTLAGIVVPRLGIFKMLLIAGIAMAATNLMFAWIAATGPSVGLFYWTIISDGITTSVSSVAFVAFLNFYVSHLHAAGQYGALASLGTASRTFLGGFSGLLIDGLGGNWSLFFVLTSVAVVPSLFVLAIMAIRFKSRGGLLGSKVGSGTPSTPTPTEIRKAGPIPNSGRSGKS